MMHEAIDRSNHRGLIWKDFIPRSKWLIGGDQQRSMLAVRELQYRRAWTPPDTATLLNTLNRADILSTVIQ
jgi:hypothetical protein